MKKSLLRNIKRNETLTQKIVLAEKSFTKKPYERQNPSKSYERLYYKCKKKEENQLTEQSFLVDFPQIAFWPISRCLLRRSKLRGCVFFAFWGKKKATSMGRMETNRINCWYKFLCFVKTHSSCCLFIPCKRC